MANLEICRSAYRFSSIAVVVVLWWAGFATSARGSLMDQSEVFDRKITSDLAARDPEGAELFRQAKLASDRKAFDAAADLYARVRERDPWFSHATRRLCGMEIARHNFERGLALCNEAFSADPSPVNEAALAQAISERGGNGMENAQEAYGHALNAADNAPGDGYVQLVLCQYAAVARESKTLSRCVQKLKVLDPETQSTLYFSMIDHGLRGELDEAQADLDRAHVLGMPDEAYRQLSRAIYDSRSPLYRYGILALKSVAGWLAGLALLLGIAGILSRLTLGAVSQNTSSKNADARKAEAVLRRVYRAVLWLTCAYYYASLPIVALTMLGLGAGLIYLCLAAGQIPIKLVLVTLIVVTLSLWAIVRSIFVRGRDDDPGVALDLGENPRLRGVLDEVAARIGTRPVDAVYVTPGTEIAVLERGSLGRQLGGQAERCLVLGAGVLDGMRVQELKAILAHEYGHFRNEDTAGGGFALAVRRSLMTMATHMARRGVASPINPAWWFVRSFHALFLRVSQGASRLQEVLADRWAAFAYGSEAFSHGLSHVVARSVRFDAHVSATLGEVIPGKIQLHNLYSFEPKEPIEPAKVDEAVQKAMSRPSSPYDSHPRPVDRIAAVEKIAASLPPGAAEDSSQAWSLFASRATLESQMTGVIRKNLAHRGVRLLAEDDDSMPDHSEVAPRSEHA